MPSEACSLQLRRSPVLPSVSLRPFRNVLASRDLASRTAACCPPLCPSRSAFIRPSRRLDRARVRRAVWCDSQQKQSCKFKKYLVLSLGYRYPGTRVGIPTRHNLIGSHKT
eukprot:642789-Rhodomonas_salina.2